MQRRKVRNDPRTFVTLICAKRGGDLEVESTAVGWTIPWHCFACVLRSKLVSLDDMWLAATFGQRRTEHQSVEQLRFLVVLQDSYVQ